MGYTGCATYGLTQTSFAMDMHLIYLKIRISLIAVLNSFMLNFSKIWGNSRDVWKCLYMALYKLGFIIYHYGKKS
jgi:hypothetical protein